MLSFTTLTLVLAALPQEEVQASFVAATVADTGSVVRSFHHQDMPVLAELEAEAMVKVVATRAPWARVQIPGGFTVWVWADYVDVTGEQGVLNASHVRARPMPSTSAKSYPVGQFSKGDAVWIVGEKEGWLQVRAPESLGAWAELSSLQMLDAIPVDWNSNWQAAAAAFEVVEVETDEPLVEVEEPLVDPVDTTAVVETTPEELAPEVVEVDANLVALTAAEASLNELAQEWNSELASQLESVFGAVLWTSSDVDAMKRARFGLERLDAISIQQNSPAVAATGTAQESTSSPAEASAKFNSASMKPEYSLVGKLEFTPEVYSAVPFTITTGSNVDSVMSRDGRFDLKDFRNKEVAVRGVWRQSALKGHRVLEITSIRIVPPPVVEEAAN